MPETPTPPVTAGQKFITLQQAAERLGLSHWTLRAWIAEGRIAQYRSPGGGRAIRLRLTDVDDLLVRFAGGNDAA